MFTQTQHDNKEEQIFTNPKTAMCDNKLIYKGNTEECVQLLPSDVKTKTTQAVGSSGGVVNCRLWNGGGVAEIERITSDYLHLCVV